MPPAPKSKVAHPAHASALTHAEFALMCYLRLHPAVAKTYGITKCNGMTTIGSMLVQTLEAQGMGVEWHERLPKGVSADEGTPNERGAKWIKKAKPRPRAGLKQLKDRPTVAPPDEAAVLRKGKGRLPRVRFPLLASLARRKKRGFSNTGNEITAPCEAALCDRDCVVGFIEKKLRCACGKRLCFVKGQSRQVAACASWAFTCEAGCPLSVLHTSKPMGDDYELNASACGAGPAPSRL